MFRNLSKFAVRAAGMVKPMRPLFAKLGKAALVTSSAAAAYSVNAMRVNSVECTPAVPLVGLHGTKFERTFIALKPDAVQRGLIGDIIKRFEQKGFQLVGLKLVHPTKEMAEGHYADLKGKPFFDGLTDFFSSGPIVCMVWQGQGVVATGRQMMGQTNPATSMPGSIRGDFCVHMGRNIIHGSDSKDAASHEIQYWFKEGELTCWTPSNSIWIYE